MILLRPKMGVAPLKHDVIIIPTQQYTNTKYISLERYHLLVSIMLRYMDKSNNIFGGHLQYFALKCDKFRQ